MFCENQLWIAKSDEEGGKRVCILPGMANRHGLIAGATGTGKTITLKVLAESFSQCGVPVFLADVKGDLAGMCKPGADSEDMKRRIERFGLAEAGFCYQEFPTCFWDIYEEGGLPLRTTVSEMGPILLARLLDLNQTQSDILSIAFRVADDMGLLLIDIKDLKAMLQYIGENCKEFTTQYGTITKQSVGAIVRALANMTDQGGQLFFGEPALDIQDWLRTDPSGRGMINILHCLKLINNPLMYSTFMVWMLSELYEMMPEAGDCQKPKIVFFFDEAHLLFKNAPKALMEKIEQVVKLIRSKGVGIYFISQSPSDIPDEVLAQLGNRIQHALRAYTPSDQKLVRAAARSFCVNPAFDTEEAIAGLGIGEALVSFLDEEGRPSMVERCHILPPESLMGPILEEERLAVMKSDGIYGRYGTYVDRDSAYEYLARKGQQKEREEEARKKREAVEKEKKAGSAKSRTSGRTRRTPLEKAADSAMSAIGREVGRRLVRGLFSNLKF